MFEREESVILWIVLIFVIAVCLVAAIDTYGVVCP